MFVNRTFKNEIVSYTDSAKPKKDIITDELLFKADTFSFGTKIGTITNKGSALFALIDNFEEGSEEYNTCLTRLKTLPCIQNKEIDKTKNGNKTKGIPAKWIKYEKGEEFNNSVLVDKHPYFFIYLYSETKKKYRDYKKSFEKKAKQMFGMKLEDVLAIENPNEEVIEFIRLYEHKNPVIDSNSVMNRICRKVEDLNAVVQLNKNICSEEGVFECYFDEDLHWDWNVYKKVVKGFKDFKEDIRLKNSLTENWYTYSSFYDPNNMLNILTEDLCEYMTKYCSNEYEVANYLLYYMYKDGGVKANREMVWNSYGHIFFENVLKSSKSDTFQFPIKNHAGDIYHLGERFKVKEISING